MVGRYADGANEVGIGAWVWDHGHAEAVGRGRGREQRVTNTIGPKFDVRVF